MLDGCIKALCRFMTAVSWERSLWPKRLLFQLLLQIDAEAAEVCVCVCVGTDCFSLKLIPCTMKETKQFQRKAVDSRTHTHTLLRPLHWFVIKVKEQTFRSRGPFSLHVHPSALSRSSYGLSSGIVRMKPLNKMCSCPRIGFVQKWTFLFLIKLPLQRFLQTRSSIVSNFFWPLWTQFFILFSADAFFFMTFCAQTV